MSVVCLQGCTRSMKQQTNPSIWNKKIVGVVVYLEGLTKSIPGTLETQNCRWLGASVLLSWTGWFHQNVATAHSEKPLDPEAETGSAPGTRQRWSSDPFQLCGCRFSSIVVSVAKEGACGHIYLHSYIYICPAKSTRCRCLYTSPMDLMSTYVFAIKIDDDLGRSVSLYRTIVYTPRKRII